MVKPRSGIEILEDVPGTGERIERHHFYRMSLKMWLNKGDAIKWTRPFGILGESTISPDGHTLTADYRLDRECLFSGLFYGIEGMRVGGIQKLRISPHMAFGERGVPGIIPEDAVLVAEITILEERPDR